MKSNAQLWRDDQDDDVPPPPHIPVGVPEHGSLSEKLVKEHVRIMQTYSR
jgi:hypothetical protein